MASQESSWPNRSRRYASSLYAKNPERSASANTPSSETRICSIIFRIKESPFTCCARGVHHLSPIRHQVGPKLIARAEGKYEEYGGSRVDPSTRGERSRGSSADSYWRQRAP